MDSKIKETLTKFYDKVNPERIDYNCNSDEEINELRRLRNAFMEESSKYQEMIDRKIMEKFDALKYEGKYIRYFHNGEHNAISYIKCTKVERYDYSCDYGIKIKGLCCTVYSDGSGGQAEIDMDDNSWVSLNYSDIDEEVEIISEEEYTKRVTEAVNNALNKLLEK